MAQTRVGLLLGIDPGLASTGYALLSGDNQVLACGTIKTVPGPTGPRTEAPRTLAAVDALIDLRRLRLGNLAGGHLVSHGMTSSASGGGGSGDGTGSSAAEAADVTSPCASTIAASCSSRGSSAKTRVAWRPDVERRSSNSAQAVKASIPAWSSSVG